MSPQTPPPRPGLRTQTRSRENSTGGQTAAERSTSSRSVIKSPGAVTGINYPPTAERSRVSSSNTAVDSSPKSGKGLEANGSSELDAIWDTIRAQKEKKLSKEKSKVESLEQVADEWANAANPQQQLYQPSMIEEENQPPPQPERPLRPRRKSISHIRESADGKSIVMVFDMTGVCKEDIHVGFQSQTSNLCLTWATAELTEWEENGVQMRERTERFYTRTIPLAEGTRLREVHGQMYGSKLVLRYPNMRCIRVEAPPLNSR
ncbi:hypothetical protein DL96DRAFT_1705782 [Flagelloscypha sp. PMI_526]|nr:hypothetical protein DL96DRAFT_1705782 [Flagelloscypha sp. PMI_526]